MAAAEEMNERNLAQAVMKGAKTMTYYCVGCTHTAKAFFPDDPNHHYIFAR